MKRNRSRMNGWHVLWLVVGLLVVLWFFGAVSITWETGPFGSSVRELQVFGVQVYCTADGLYEGACERLTAS